jgi:transposase
MKGNKKSKAAGSKQAGSAGLPKIRAMVAGIDVGSDSHYVCAPTRDGGTEMRVFGGTTGELLKIAEWLQQSQVESVAMESTGGICCKGLRGFW